MNKWIKTTHELPEVCERVLIFSDRFQNMFVAEFVTPGNYPIVHEASFVLCNDFPGDYYSSFTLSQIRFWMKLPESPNEEN